MSNKNNEFRCCLAQNRRHRYENLKLSGKTNTEKKLTFSKTCH